MSEKERLTKLEDEIDVMKSELAASARSLLRKRKENERAAEEVLLRRARLERVRKQYGASKQKLEVSEKGTKTVEEAALEAEQDLKEAEADASRQDRALAALKEAMFKQSQALFALRQAEANSIAEISGSQAQARNLQAKIRQLDGESVRQQELIYNAEFQIQQMERKVARGMGERSDDEKKQLAAQIETLERELQVARDRRKMLTQQARRLNNELRAAQRRGELASTAQLELETRITELELENDSAERSLKARTATEEESMVANDIMRLELKRLRDALSQRADKVFTLENRKQQLKLSMLERKREISVHKDVQAAQLRLAEDERHRAQIELGARRQHVHKLNAKYETLCKTSRLRGNDADDGGDDGGEPKSQAYYLIQAAQKREELQRQGDELDQEIRRREREMRALEATLAHVNTRNATYRSSFQKADLKSAEAEDLHQLEEQTKLAQDALFRRKKELQRLATDFDEDDRRLQQVDQQCARLEERNAHLKEAREQMQLELTAQNESLLSLEQRLERLSDMHRRKQGADQETVQEQHFKYLSLNEANNSVLVTLGELAKAYPELKETLANMLQDAGLPQ